jgi:zinc/manganese transport system permease protein
MLPPDLGYLLWPFLACLVLTGIHGYLGIHVIERKVIFVDLALAQIAALGTTVGILLGIAGGSASLYLFSLGSTLLGAAVFALTRMREERIPQEAVIGIVYAVASAGMIVAVDASRDPHGAEHIKGLLAGSIVWVRGPTIVKTAVLYAVIGAIHWALRKRFLLISREPDVARARGVRIRLWDFVFYATFGFVITSSVQIAGVLLVFCFLIVPAAFAMLFFAGLRPRLIAAWCLGAVVSFVGLLFSYDRPSGPVIVCLFGLVLLLAGVVRHVVLSPGRGRALAHVGLGALAAAALIAFGLLLATSHDDEPDHAHGDAVHETDVPDPAPADLDDPDPAVRERAAAAATAAELLARLEVERDEGVRLAIGRALLPHDRIAAARVLVDLLETAELASGGALETLREVAGTDFGYDPDAADNTVALTRFRAWIAAGAVH